MYDDYDANGQPPAIPDEPTPVTGVTDTGKDCVQNTVPESQHLPEQEIASEPEQTPDPDTIPELPADADRNERIRQANLIMAQIRRLYGQKETGTYISFAADLGIIVRVRALKERIGGHDFIQAAHDCGVRKNAAYDIIRLRLSEKVDDIKQNAELAKRKAEAKGIPFTYPDIRGIIKEYRPPRPPKAKPDGGGDDVGDVEDVDDEDGAHGSGDGGPKNRAVREIRRENLDLSEANRLLAVRLAKAEQEAKNVCEEADRRVAQMRLDRDAAERRAEEAERRAIAAETRLAEVLTANNNRDTDDPPPDLTLAVDSQEDIGEPLLPPVVRDNPSPDPPKKKRGRSPGSKNKPRNNDNQPPPPPVNSYGIVAKYIYESDGPAGEYAPLTANPYLGCGHKCKYCFVPRVRHITREEFDRGAEAREQFISHLIRDAAKYQAAGITEQVLISFTSDPYHRFDTSLTRQTFEALAAHGLAFCALSKGGTRVLRDADIFRPTRDAYAFSLTSTDVTFSANWEPDAAPPADRMLAAKLMRDKFGIYVWNSLEPILDIEHTLRVVEATHGFVNLYKVGPVHYLGGKYSKPDLRDYTLRLVDAFTKHNARAYFKRDLQPFLPDGYPNPMRVPQHH